MQDVGVRYGAVPALAAISLIALASEVLVLVGPNGSGKSSLVRSVAGIQRHDGQVGFADPQGPRPRSSVRIGYVPQDIGSRTALTVTETVLLGRIGQLGLRVSDADLDAVKAVLASLDVLHLAARHLGELSGGQRQLVFLAQALAAEPDVLLLDEPTSALDVRHQLEVLEIVRSITAERGLATVVVLHDLNAAARFADRIAVLDGGRLYGTGAPAATLTAAMLGDVFGIEAHVAVHGDGRPSVTPLRAIRGRTAA